MTSVMMPNGDHFNRNVQAHWNREVDMRDMHDVQNAMPLTQGTIAESDLRLSLKIVRDPTKTAFDVLPSGETIGEFANRHAVERYTRKVENKRERARESRRKKRRSGIISSRATKNPRRYYTNADVHNTRKGVQGQAA
jgi:hypothetical protein